MAIDTRNRRASVIGLDLLALRVLPSPDGTIDAGDRAQLAGKYRGTFEAAAGGAGPFRPLWRPRRR